MSTPNKREREAPPYVTGGPPAADEAESATRHLDAWLERIDFPATKQDILADAEEAVAPSKILLPLLADIPSREYPSAADVKDEVLAAVERRKR